MLHRSVITTEDYLDWLENQRPVSSNGASRAGLLDMLLAALSCAAAGLPMLLMGF